MPAVADLLAPLVRHGLTAELLASPWIQCDDTTLDVQVEDREPHIREGHMWTYRALGGEVVYDFTWARTGAGPEQMLAAYRGYLQVDAAPAYDRLFASHPEIVEVGCMAHARRYFKAAVPSAAAVAVPMLTHIGELYGIERAGAGLTAEARRTLRPESAVPLLERLRQWLEQLAPTVLPKSPLAEAIGYMRGNWQALTRYTEDGRLKIDNNGAERAIKPVVLGRKNWLFCGSEAAAHRAAILLSLVQTCKHVGVDPFAYLRDVIERVSTHPMAPHRRAHAAAVAAAAAGPAKARAGGRLTGDWPARHRDIGGTASARQAVCQDDAATGVGSATRLPM